MINVLFAINKIIAFNFLMEIMKDNAFAKKVIMIKPKIVNAKNVQIFGIIVLINLLIF